jgi:hypothetical protein
MMGKEDLTRSRRAPGGRGNPLSEEVKVGKGVHIPRTVGNLTYPCRKRVKEVTRRKGQENKDKVLGCQCKPTTCSHK